MNREVCGQCDAPVDLCECFDIFTYKRWCNSCKQHVNEDEHYQVCRLAYLEMYVLKLEAEVRKLKNS